MTQLLKSAIDDIICAYQKFATTSVICCALQLDNVESGANIIGLCADQTQHIKLNQILEDNVPAGNNLDLIKYVHNHSLSDAKLSTYNGTRHHSFALCTHAAVGGHLDILQWAQANNYQLSPWICSTATYNGHLDIIKWARANGSEWGEATCLLAAYVKRLDILQWVRAHGCGWGNQRLTFEERDRTITLTWAEPLEEDDTNIITSIPRQNVIMVPRIL